MMKSLLPLSAAMALLPQSAAPPAPEKALPQMDAGRMAKRVVGALQPMRGERAIVVYDPGYYPDLAEAVQVELSKAGAYPVVALTFEPLEIIEQTPEGTAEAKRREEAFIASLRPLFREADIFLWLPARALPQDVRWERLLEASHARGIHFHWIEVLQGKSPEEIVQRSRMYERAILDTDYAALSAEQDRLMAALRGHALHITTPDGTDLRLRVAQDAWFHKNDGDISPARARLARAVRDREMEFPSGALRFLPDATSAEGKLVVAKARTAAGTAEGVTIEFVHGHAVRVTARTNEAGFLALWNQAGGDVDKVGEIVLGTNPLLATPLAANELPYYGYGAGFLRVSLGDNWESGGTNRSPGHRPLWLFLEHGTMETENEVLVREGRLVK
jgi:leucyl aminopeptidase (aminopeptidase T)